MRTIFNRISAKLNEKIFDKIANKIYSPDAKREFNEAAQAAVIPMVISTAVAGFMIGNAVAPSLAWTLYPFAYIICGGGGLAAGAVSGVVAAKKFLGYLRKRAMR